MITIPCPCSSILNRNIKNPYIFTSKHFDLTANKSLAIKYGNVRDKSKVVMHGQDKIK